MVEVINPTRPGYECPEMVAFVAGHIRQACRFPSGQARLSIETAEEAARVALDAMRSWNFMRDRRAAKAPAVLGEGGK